MNNLYNFYRTGCINIKFIIKKIFHRGFIFVACLLILLGGCKTKKQAFHYTNIKPMRAVKLYDHVQFCKTRFKTLSLKFSAEYRKGNESQSFGGTIRIKNDTMIWISIVPALGIEAARLLITKDSIKFINRLKSTYYTGNYNFLRDMLNLDIDYEMLQCLLSNELFIYSRNPEMDETIRGFKSTADSSGYVIKSLKARKVSRKLKKNKIDDLILQEVHILPELYKVSRLFINDFEYRKSIDVNYSDFEDADTQVFPRNIDCKIINKDVGISITIGYSKVTINKELEYPFSIPEKYTKTFD